MKVLVSDTSVLIDLERGGLLDSCFRLPFEFAVPDLLYRHELAGFGGSELIARGLRVEELTPEELTVAQDIRRINPKLSLSDAFAYALAVARRWTLLTGDGELRMIARVKKIPFFGVLWIVDNLFDGQVVSAADLAASLEVIADHPRCRLPRADIQARLEMFRKK